CLNSKKIVLSLATISFLASYANATLTPEIKTYDEANKNVKARSASVYRNTNTTVSGSETNTINISNQGSHSITIEKNGTLGNENNNNKIIYVHAGNSNTLTLTNLTNNGTINGKVAVENSSGNFTGTITVNTFENTGQINGQIYMGIWGNNPGTLNIDKFDNSGTIAVSNNNEGVFFEGKNTNIQTFNNNGFISGSEGVSLSSGTINSFNNNGTINGNSFGIFVYGGNIQTLENSGTIISNSNDSSHAGIKLENGGTIENIINTGSIRSNAFGISVTYGKFGTLTIKNGGMVYGKYSGIAVGQWQTLGDLYIDGHSNNGTVSGIYSEERGISLDTGSRTQKIELKNGGIIKGNIHGIRLDNGASLSGEMILSGEGSRVEGG
ncbi:hypothetical protein ACM1EB_001853, partial [Campylobacter jejuni]